MNQRYSPEMRRRRFGWWRRARPTLEEMIRFIDMHRAQFGVELICRVLRDVVRGFLTSRGYRTAKTRPPRRGS